MSEVYMSLALDPVSETIEITGFGKTQDECAKALVRSDFPYRRIFHLTDAAAGRNLYDWLRSCGLVHTYAVETARQIVKVIGEDILEHPPTPGAQA